MTYREEGDKKIADKVVLIEHMDPALEFAGTLVDWSDESLTLSNESLTATFQMDEETYLVGDLSQGDQIELTYLGDLSEHPYANVVAVVTEADQPDMLTVHGVVSELADGTLLLGIDSAHAYRFGVNTSTAVFGAANEAQVGDRVDIAYQGNLKETPSALQIVIVKQGQNRSYTINGKISDVTNSAIVLATDKGTYTFGITGDTRYNGEKPAKDYKAEITYSGSLIDKPVAVIMVLLLCFPITYIVPVGVAAFIAAKIPSPFVERPKE